jgi:hypothetical protein
MDSVSVVLPESNSTVMKSKSRVEIIGTYQCGLPEPCYEILRDEGLKQSRIGDGQDHDQLFECLLHGISE